VDLQFFIKLSEIPDLAERLQDPEFNDRLRTNPGDVFAEYGINIPPNLIPDEVNLPSPARIAEIRDILGAISEGGEDDEMFWFPFILAPKNPWFPFPWFPWFRGGGDVGGDPPAA
jgi:hypothetical protein